MSKCTKILCCICVAGMLCLCGPAWAKKLIVERPQAGYTLALPSGWVEIPAQELQERQKALEKVRSSSRSQESLYDDAFQFGEKPWFSYPYILVRVYDKGRIPEPRIEDMNARIQEQLEAAPQANSMVQDTRLVDTAYDPGRHTFVAEMSFQMQRAQPLKAMHAVCYTNQGLLQFTFYATDRTWRRHVADFEQGIADLQLNADTVYQSSFLDKIPLLTTLRWRELGPILAVSFGIGIVLAVGGMLFIRRRR